MRGLEGSQNPEPNNLIQPPASGMCKVYGFTGFIIQGASDSLSLSQYQIAKASGILEPKHLKPECHAQHRIPNKPPDPQRLNSHRTLNPKPETLLYLNLRLQDNSKSGTDKPGTPNPPTLNVL